MLPVERKRATFEGDTCSFRQESNDLAQTPIPIAAPPSEPQTSKTRGTSVSRKRNASGKTQSEKFNRPPCTYFMKGTCTKSPCEYWHPPEVNSFKLNLDVSSAHCEKCTTVELRITGH